MKTIFIPSDFSNHSLEVAQATIAAIDEDICLMFVHMFRIPDTTQDLLFSSYRRADAKYVSEKFKYEAEEMKDLFSHKVKTVKIDFFYGKTVALFKNYLNYNNVSLIAYSSKNGVGRLSKSSIDPLPVVKKSGYKHIDIDSVEVATTIKSIFTGY